MKKPYFSANAETAAAQIINRKTWFTDQMKMKIIFRLAAVITVSVISLALFSSCYSENSSNADVFTVVCTGFPQYDWVKSIMGEIADNSNIILLTENGTDLHSYQASAADMRSIANSDLFIYNGGESDKWAADFAAQNPQIISFQIMSSCNAVEEEKVEGMQDSEDDHSHGNEETELDEHVWLSLRNAKLICSDICSLLCEADSENAELYKKNTESYCARIDELDMQFSTLFSSASDTAIVVADRFPFRYLCEDYGIAYYAAFPGCSADSEASFETIVFLSKKLDELDLNTIFITETSDGSIADTVRDNTQKKNQNIVTLYSMQSVTAEEIASGETYLGIMQKNLDAFTIALKG